MLYCEPNWMLYGEANWMLYCEQMFPITVVSEEPEVDDHFYTFQRTKLQNYSLHRRGTIMQVVLGCDEPSDPSRSN
jgi:hypothetical protein